MNFTDNPFFLLDASPRDSKKVLHEKAENKSFELDEEVCRNAERILLNPKKRLDAEVSWFPGLSPQKIKKVLKQIIEDAKKHNYDSDFFSQFDDLSKANAFAFFLFNISDSGSWSQEDIECIIQEFCESVSEIDADLVLDSINEDRVASGFPEIPCEDEIEAELEVQQHDYKKILHSFLDVLDSCVIVDALTHLIEENTLNGECECDWCLLEDIITDYEMDVIPFFEKQEGKIESDIANITNDMRAGKKWIEIQEKFNILKRDILLWDRIAQPIQVLFRSKGIDHKRSDELFDRIRKFALLAHNRYDCTELSIKITELLQSVFAELRIAAETAAEDKKQLHDILQDRKEEEAALAARKKELQYFFEWGIFFKKSVRFDFESITINGTDTYKLSDITGILWGATRNSVNGIPCGTTYKVCFIAENQYVSVPIKNDTVYENVIQRLFKTAGISILRNTLDKLEKGNTVPFRNIRLLNKGIEMKRKNWLSSETKYVPWAEMKPAYSYNGYLWIESKDENFSAALSYQEDYNVHILEIILKTVFKTRGIKTVTEAFQKEI